MLDDAFIVGVVNAGIITLFIYYILLSSSNVLIWFRYKKTNNNEKGWKR